MHEHDINERRYLFPQLRWHLLARGALAVGGLALASALYVYSASTYLAHSLATANVREEVVLDGTPYTIEGSEVRGPSRISPIAAFRARRLAYTKAAAARNPVLTLAGTNLDSMKHAIDALAATEAHLARLQSGSDAAMLIEDSLFPIDFLHAAAEAEQARRSFVMSGSANDATAYRRAQYAAIAAYRNARTSFERTFALTVPDAIGPYIAAGDQVTPLALRNNLAKMRVGIASVESIVRTRERCERGFIFACKVSDIQLPVLPSVHAGEEEGAEAHARAVRSLLETGNRHATWDQPLIKLAHSYCAENMPRDALFALRNGFTSDRERYLQPMMLNDIRFTDSTSQAHIPFYGYFNDRGVRYVLNTPLSHYSCPEFGVDLGSIFSVNAVIEFAKTHAASSETTGATSEKLRGMEERLKRVNTVATEALAREYVNTALAARETMSPATVESIISLSVALQNRSAGFENSIAWIAAIENQNALLLEKGIRVALDAPYLLYVRSAYPVTFLMFNPSFGFAEERVYEAITIPEDRQPYVYYSSLPHDPESERRLLNDYRAYIDVHDLKFTAD